MKGCLYERPKGSGRWAIVIDLPREGGRRRQKWFTFEGTKRQAQLELAKRIASRETLPNAGKQTLAQYLDNWIEEQRIGVKSHERYADLIRKNIIPALGHIALAKLTGDQISAYYTKALAQGRRDGKGGLSPGTVKFQHIVLKKALKNAVVRGLLLRNPLESVTSPHVEKAIMKTLDLSQAGRVIEDVRGTRLFVPVFLALTCGLRRGEILALRWSSVDLDNATLTVAESVEQTKGVVRIKRPKSGRGRVVDLSEMVVTELRKYRAQQESEFKLLGAQVTEDTFLCTREDGERMSPQALSIAWMRWTANRKPRVRFHDLRHAHATHLLASGVHPKIAQERLGHASVGITLDIYSHVLPGMQADAARKVGDALTAAMLKSQDKG
jgi:integrase